jgi:hypothetical protein
MTTMPTGRLTLPGATARLADRLEQLLAQVRSLAPAGLADVCLSAGLDKPAERLCNALEVFLELKSRDQTDEGERLERDQ